MKDVLDAKLTLFFSGGVGLEVWKANGGLQRELALYKRLSHKLGKVSLLTYGGRADRSFRGELGDVALAASSWIHRPHRLSNYLAPLNFLLAILNCNDTLSQTDIIKTNQISGSDIAVMAKRFYHKKLFVRCGYVASRLAHIAVRHGLGMANLGSLKNISANERKAFKNADIISVPTPSDRDWIVERYDVSADKIRVIPNYVETDRFIAMPEVRKKYDLVFMGRNSAEKNIAGLLEALAMLNKSMDLSILFIGSCGRSKEVSAALKDGVIKGAAIGNVESAQLPKILAEAKIFIISSFYEGNSKALLEAMSCGMPCIGTDVDSINTVITHRKNGYLCPTDGEGIADAISAVLKDPRLQEDMGRQARRYVSERFDLDKVLEMEMEAIGHLCRENAS